MASKLRVVKNILALLALGGTGLAVACGGDARKTTHVLSEGCSVNSDCDNPLVCAFQKCHNACTESRDCPNKERCVASDRPFHVCQLTEEKLCSYNSQCPIGQLCGVDGQCRDQCATDRDCVTAQICVSGTCAETSELTNGQLPTNNGADASTGGTPCRYSTECPDPMLCRGGTCSYECLGDRDCAAGSTCAGNLCSQPTQVTPTPDAAKTCIYNSDCNPGVCRFGVCVPECREDRDCAPGNACVSGACVKQVPPDAPSGYGTTCNIPSDCTPPLICGSAGQCVYQCNTNVDCTPGLCCFSHECTTGPVCQFDGGTTPDAGGGDAATGAPCVSNADCDDNVWCNGPERCYAAHCAAALDTPCNSHSACIKDVCNEAAKTCSSTVLAPQDFDKDTHLDYACGGDDCDDKDDTVYTGAKELCDGKDNNCNGVIDDHSRGPHGPLMVGTVQNGGWCNGCTPVAQDGGAGAVLGTGSVMFYGSKQYNFGGTLYAQYFDATGASPAGLVQVFGTANGSGIVGVEVLDADGEQNTAAVVYWRGSTSWPLTIFVGDTTLASPDPLLPRTYKEKVLLPIGSSAGNADVVWTGSNYLVGFTNSAGSPFVALIDTSANFVGGMQPVTTPGNGLSSPIRVAASGSTLAAAYIDTTAGNHAAISILSSSGAPQVGPIVLPNIASLTTSFWALAGTTGGYVLAYKDNALGDVVTFVASDGTIGKTTKLPQQGANQGMGVSDGAGAGFALRYSDGTHFVYAKGPLDAVEETVALTGTNPTSSGDWASISARAGRLTAFHYGYNESRMYAIDVGCP